MIPITVYMWPLPRVPLPLGKCKRWPIWVPPSYILLQNNSQAYKMTQRRWEWRIIHFPFWVGIYIHYKYCLYDLMSTLVLSKGVQKIACCQYGTGIKWNEVFCLTPPYILHGGLVGAGVLWPRTSLEKKKEIHCWFGLRFNRFGNS